MSAALCCAESRLVAAPVGRSEPPCCLRPEGRDCRLLLSMPIGINGRLGGVDSLTHDNVRTKNNWRSASALNHPPGSVRQLGGSYTLLRVEPHPPLTYT